MILAIDQGTTGTTCLVVDEELTVAGRGYAAVDQHYPRPGWVEHDPEQLWETVLAAGQQALSDADIRPDDLHAIGITNQRETAIAWDGATGRPLHRAIVWQDTRTAAQAARLPADLVRVRTGLVPSPYFSATKFAWLLDAAAPLPSRPLLGTVDSWLIWKLTGGELHVTDPTNASRTLLYDLAAEGWDAELLELFSLDQAALPRIVPSSGVLGEASLLGASVPIAGLAGDQQAALVGQACFGAGEAKVTYGTGSFLLVREDGSPPSPPDGLVRTATALPRGTALEGSVFVSGAAVQWLRDELGVIATAAETERLATGLADNGGVYFVPALAGLGSPHWDPDARGLVCGLTRGSGRAHLARAALEAIAYQVRDVVSAVPGGVERLRADGGATANRFLMQFQADILGQPLEVAERQEMTALGAAMLAGHAIGVWPDAPALAQTWRGAERFEPRMDTAEADRLYAGWLEALGRARS